MIGSSNTSFRIKPPQLIADSATESAANNALAQGYQKGYVRPATQAKAGFSANAKDRMRAAQQQSAGIAEGAQAAAGIRAEDQQFNSQQRWENEMLKEQSLAFDYDQMTQQNQTHFDRNMARQTSLAGVNQARQRAAMQLRLALLSKGLA
jgi:hypothetical protein